ncbi:Chromatin remodeling factor mit1 [Drechslerella dactyloides]|uniref:Chromatin remodeling factor mit1 n=1 Tax=Drechslerella dactyloides TaxID=74499 RepID=A0AAD6NGM9_DREDA|nr:Chromatin remodeling factor mit1 [Drechslerella dactyloides]
MDEEMADANAAEASSLLFAVEIPPFDGDLTEFVYYEPRNDSIKDIIAERDIEGEQQYQVNTWDGETKWLPWDAVIGMDFGNEALTEYERRPALPVDGANEDDDYEEDERIITIDSSGDEEMQDQDGSSSNEESEDDLPMKRRRTRSAAATSSREPEPWTRRLQNRARQVTLREMVKRKSTSNISRTSSRETMTERPTRSQRTSARTAGRLISQSAATAFDPEAYDSDSSDDLIISDLVDKSRQWQKQGRHSSRTAGTVNKKTKQPHRGRPRKRARSSSGSSEDDEYEKRRSGRTAHAKGSMRERDEDDIDIQEVKTTAPRVVYQQEIFREFARQEEFSQVHTPWCETCSDAGGRHKGPLVYCQGCSSSFHKPCIGNRASREHLVTKLSDHEFVLQCKRCIRRAHKAEKRPPRLDVCTDCRQVGRSCEPFRKFPTTKADREHTPEVDVPGHQINNAMNVLFRCQKCHRAYHFHHLPLRESSNSTQGAVGIAQVRLGQYRHDWQCVECVEIGENKINDIIAWRPSDETLKETKDVFDMDILEFDHDELEYLIRMAGDHYTSARWYSGAWVYGISFAQMRVAFEKHSPTPKWTTSDAIPESYFRIDIVFEVKYTSIVPNMTENIEKQRIREVKSVFVKFKGLGYDEAMWVDPPSEDEEERYLDFKKAYFEYCKGNHVRLPRSVSKTIENLRHKHFTELEVHTQPKYIAGGTLKDYQMDGTNWLYNRWFEGKNAILADEMGLGKTIQIISFLEILHQEHKVWPFLIVAPHSTVPNWMRELRTWAPSLRVVAFYGAGEALKLTKKYELFNNAPSASARDLKCHVVVTSYQTVADHSTVLKPVPWQALIVDEGQRLKSDDTILYRELWTFKFNHKVLLTGTPLQNNIRELFNLLQFLDPKSINAEELEAKYAEVNKENLHELHDMIRPFFLRRTKAQALKDLPPISDVIVPLTVTKLQQKLYSSVLSKDAELIRAIMAKTETKASSRSKLNNILVQLRKVLCHPFVYDQEIEEKLEDQELVFRNLVDASSKLKILELLLPRLHETGHRVLMFSQFLHMLDIMEDFLSGLNLPTLRLDGSNDTAEKQKLIDAYNAPNSPYFSFLLSTRAGGVGINLATADTVIILDPDYNPHQDLQAVARAHRIGQKNKVLVFHLITVKSVEERIIQLSKKKLGLDHLIIQKMRAEGQEEEEDVDVESILKYGAEDIMKGEMDEIKYDLESIDKLLDRSQMKETLGEQEQENERDAQFSFARVWATEKGDLTEAPAEEAGALDEAPPDLELWDRILQERIERAAREAAQRQAEYGRGRRKTNQATYIFEEDDEATPIKDKARKLLSEDDTDFQESGTESDTNSEAEVPIAFDPTKELSIEGDNRSRSLLLPGTNVDTTASPAPAMPAHAPAMATHTTLTPAHAPLTPAHAPLTLAHAPLTPGANARIQPVLIEASSNTTNLTTLVRPVPKPPPRGVAVDCILCKESHMPGECPLRVPAPERCLLCGISHFGEGTTCPHLGSITQIQAMLNAIKDSNEPAHLQAIAKNYLRGRKGALTQQRKLKKAKAERNAAEAIAALQEHRKGL